jgi:hypothetical protein
VRQFGNLSFSHIFDAGHLVPMYQPETAFTVFTRVIKGVDVSMGRNVDLSTYVTEGVEDSSVRRNEAGGGEAAVCWIRDVQGTCSETERMGIEKGEGDVRNGVWNTDHDVEDVKPSKSAKSEMEKATSTVPLTGVYVATGMPVVTSTKAKSGAVCMEWGVAGALLAAGLVGFG